MNGEKKMELIDKDSLMEIMNCNKPLADGYHMKDYVFKQIIHDIDNEPIIEAIPISWIEEWLKKMPKHTTPYFYKRFLRNAIRGMIEDWRRENE